MKKIIILICTLVALLLACTPTPPSYKVTGILPDSTYNGKIVYVTEYEYSKTVDSAVVVDGKFVLTGSIDTASIRRLEIGRLFSNIILENGNINVDMSKIYGVTGTPMNDALTEYAEALEAIKAKSRESYSEVAKSEMDNEAKEAEYKKIYDINTSEINQLSEKIFWANKNNTLGSFALWQWSFVLPAEQLDSIYAESGDIVRNFKVLKNIIKRNERIRKTGVGMSFVDFTIENGNIDGTSASLSDYVGKGKYVLVDFWASWCGPCIQEMPTLKRVHDKYKGDKFELLGVAVWDKRDASLKGIEAHNITWSVIVDAQSVPTELYGINSIPQIMLFGPDGTILARDLRGEALEAKVAEVMQLQ